eukprot:213194-Pyramimonas_sp.AAC.1
MFCGIPPFASESRALQAFLPKGECDGDTQAGERDRDVNAVRALGLRSTSYNVITASVNYAIRKPLDKCVPPSQRG